MKLGLFGASGRMGVEVCELLKNQNDFIPAVAISSKAEISVFQKTLKNISDVNPEDIDLWIDFSLPSGFDIIVDHCIKYKKPLVTGTTGLSTEQLKKIDLAGKSIPILWSSNMSLGILVLKKAIETLAALPDFDFQIEEFHHIHKKDKPSGTAVTLQKKLSSVLPHKEIPEPLSIRGGGIFGVHKVWSMSAEEVLCFEHQALNRKVFARGALWAARKIFNKPAAVYKLDELVQWP